MSKPAPRTSAAPSSARPARPAREPLGVLEVAGLVVCCATAVLAALISVLLTPLYWGSALVPLAVVLAALSNVVLPVIALRLGRSGFAAALPFGVWLIAVVVLGITRPEGDVLLPTGPAAQYLVTYGMLLAGGVAGSITLMVRGLNPPASDPAAGPAEPAGPEGSPARR
jgi:hypothetical protein